MTTYTKTESILKDWATSLSDVKYKKLLNSKLSFIECYSIDQEQTDENLPEQAWDKETYHELFGEYTNDYVPIDTRSTGSKHWFVHGKRHRTDGPAIEWGDGTKFWYLNGKRLTEAEWLEAIK